MVFVFRPSLNASAADRRERLSTTTGIAAALSVLRISRWERVL